MRGADRRLSWSLTVDGRMCYVDPGAMPEAFARDASSEAVDLSPAMVPLLRQQEKRQPVARRRSGRMRHDELLAQQLQVLTRSGIGPVESLRTLAKQADRDYAAVLSTVRLNLESGASLADALDACGDFDPMLGALVRSAERTSDLDLALGQYLKHRERVNGLRQRVITAAVYPTLLMIVGSLVLLLLLFQVVPRFSVIFKAMHSDLPWAARLMLQWGTLVQRHHLLLAVIGVSLTAVVGLVFWSHRARAIVVLRLSRLNAIGRQLKSAGLCRYYRTMASLLGGGLPLPQAMGMAGELLPSYLLEAGHFALDRVNEGVAPTEALEAAGLSTPVTRQLVEAGQRTGQLAAMMERAAEFHEAELAQRLERFMRLLEPTVMTFVGTAIGVLVILMYLPIFELASAVR